ncbi:MAG: response regulator, partial [Magnetococcales bacterium]|nr:response regulator [Magnetococcales bacterium]
MSLESKNQLPKILVVDDQHANLVAMEAMLSHLPAEIRTVSSGNSALQEVLCDIPALVLLDVDMPEMNGFEVAEMMKSVESTRRIPILFLTAAFKEESHRLRGYDIGAVDYLEKPLNEEVLLAKINVFLELHAQRQEILRLNQDLEARVEERTEDLQESRRAMETLVDNLDGMVYRCRNDQHWSMSYVSEGCMPLTGYRQEALIDNREIAYADLIHSEDREMVWESVQSALDHKAPFELTYRITRSDQESRWVWEKGRGVWAESGELLALEGLISDITLQKQ